MFSKLFSLTSYAALAAAAVVSIDVSSSSGAIAFSPNSATANVGDEVVFNWQAGGHSVVQGQGTNAACQPMANGFFGGFQSPPATFTIQVNDTNPIWFYCSTSGHCQAGMVGVINPPQGQSVQDYAKAAGSASSNPSPNVPPGSGGVLQKSGGTPTLSGGSSNTASGSSTGSGSSTSSTSTSTGSSGNSGPYGGGGGTTTSSSSSSSSSKGAASGYDIPTAFALLLAGAFAAYM